MDAAVVAPDLEPASAYPEIAAVRHALNARDWNAAKAIIEGADWTGRAHLTLAIGDLPGAEVELGRIVEAEPDDVVAATALAARLIGIGWEIRTTARARYVSQHQFEAMHDYLRRAERILIDVTAREPGAAVAWQCRLATARGLGLGQAEARRRYDQVVKRVPHFLPAQASLLQQLCPKWGGSFDTMHAFARECSGAAAPGAHNAVLIAEAHLEHAFDLDDAEKLQYLKASSVRTEIREAAQKSVLHHDFARTPGWVGVQNTFAMMLTLVEDYRAAAVCFAGLGPLATRHYWSYLGDPAESFLEYRKLALRKGGKS